MTPSWLSSNPDMQRAERSHVILAGEFNLEISFKAWENEEINSTVCQMTLNQKYISSLYSF